MMAQAQRVHIQTHQSDKVRIGPITTITLIAIISMAVLAVLAASTSHATSTISDRQANATQMMYLNECAGQEFVAGIDDALASVRSAGGSAADGARAVNTQLDKICEQARAAGNGQVDCTADVDGTTVTAEFICGSIRRLNVAITIRDDASLRIDKWKMASTQQEAPPAGTLWQG